MKLSAFKDLLQTQSDKPFRLVLPNDKAVPQSFHITEVAHVQKRFIDCGGKQHAISTCQLQAWLGTDTEHRLQAGRMHDILTLSQSVLPIGEDLDIEIEYEDAVISQYTVAGCDVSGDAVTLRLSAKHTDCLAKETCCPPQPRQPLALAMMGAQTADTAECCGLSDCCG